MLHCHHALNNGKIDCSWWYSDYAEAEDEVFGILGQFISNVPASNLLTSALCTTLGLGMEQLREKPSSGGAVFDSCWNDSRSHFPDGKDEGKREKGKYRMLPHFVIPYDAGFYKGDQYSVKGYQGIAKTALAKKSGYGTFYGEFRLWSEQ